MACLDTSFLIDLLKGNPSVRELKEDLEQKEARICIASPSVMELWSGACRAKHLPKEKEKIIDLFESLNVLVFDMKSAQYAGEIEAALSSKGLPIETEDIMIAGIAMANGEMIVTGDEHFTRVPGLRVLKY